MTTAPPDRSTVALSLEWLAVVLSGPPFDSALDSFMETVLWMLFWLFPLRLSRIEVWLVPARDGSDVDRRIAEGSPEVRRVIWRGEGGRRLAEEVEARWIGDRTLCASFRGVFFFFFWF